MKKFMILHFGFEQPTPEIMAAWGKWFESIADKQIDQGGFAGGREISQSGTRDLAVGHGVHNRLQHHRSRGPRRGGEDRSGQPLYREHQGL